MVIAMGLLATMFTTELVLHFGSFPLRDILIKIKFHSCFCHEQVQEQIW